MPQQPKPLFVLAAAGAGSRFVRAGYPMPKAEIEFLGKPLLWWSLLGVADIARTLSIRVVTRTGLLDQGLRRDVFADLNLPEPEVVLLEGLTAGQADSVLLGLREEDRDRPMAVWNVDTAIRPGEVACYRGNHLHCFTSSNPGMSFVRQSDGVVVEVAEKSVISDWASSGLYFFESVATYRAAVDLTYRSPVGSKYAEEYVAPLYDTMLRRGLRVTASLSAAEAVVPLGTPGDLEVARAIDWLSDWRRA